jgi:hypothetical protein
MQGVAARLFTISRNLRNEWVGRISAIMEPGSDLLAHIRLREFIAEDQQSSMMP